MKRQWWLGVVCVLALASVLEARQGIVKTKDGQTIEGDIDEKADANSVTISIRGVKTTIDRTSIDSIVYPGNIEDQFKDRMGKLAATDVVGRINLAHWAFDNRQYELARQADDSALKIDPRNADALQLMTVIQSTIVMESKRNSAPPPANEVPAAKPPVQEQPAPAPASMTGKLLSADDINAIRQAELQSADANARVQFNNKVKEKYLSTGGKDAARFNALTPAAQAMEIIATGDATLTKDVKILSDPASLLEFRMKLQARVLAGCAASGCHGGTNGKSFYLFNTNTDQVPVWYTNFYILQTYQTKVPGAAGGPLGGGPVTRLMIDRTDPTASLLLQFGLPQNAVMIPHPKALGFKPWFLTDEDPTYKDVSHWIGSTLKPFAPDYGIKYELPTGPSSTQPSATPAAPAAPAQ